LIEDAPPAVACYPGPQQNLAVCADLVVELTNSTFIADDPNALGYPILDACPVVDFAVGQTAGSCSIGDTPRFTVDATTPAQVAAAVSFARENNIRLVVRNTGHDILGRSTGYGSLQVWIRHLRQGIAFQETYAAPDKCTKSSWTGSAFSIAGGYVWEDVHVEAAAKNVIVVGGGDPSVGCIGGWAQGGGHSPASRNYGLGADQILDATVVLASGDIVTADACQNTDLFFAIRGGGGGTFGVVVSTTVKAHPPSAVAAQTFGMAPLTEADTPQFMDALAEIYAAYPALNDAGYSGYGSWAVQAPFPVFGSSTTGYSHSLALFGQSSAQAQSIFAPVAAKLQRYNGSLQMSTNYTPFPSYATFYSALSGVQQPVGSSGAAGSRLFDRAALTGSAAALKQMLNITAGSPGEFAQTGVSLVSGGQVFKDASDRNSGVNPAWRTSYLLSTVGRGWAAGTNASTQAEIHHDVTYNKVGAMRALAPNTGSYMNEADRLDPLYLQDFYGNNTTKLKSIKRKYDPHSVFYCPTCVGSENWAEDSTGRLCPA
jgi:FAD/FMN-containing dehydrogenase